MFPRCGHGSAVNEVRYAEEGTGLCEDCQTGPSKDEPTEDPQNHDEEPPARRAHTAVCSLQSAATRDSRDALRRVPPRRGILSGRFPHRRVTSRKCNASAAAAVTRESTALPEIWPAGTSHNIHDHLIQVSGTNIPACFSILPRCWNITNTVTRHRTTPVLAQTFIR